MALKPNLGSAQRRIMALMGDDTESATEVIVTYDEQAAADDVFDRETLTWAAPVGAEVIYNGKCLIGAKVPDRYFDVGQVENLRGEWKLTMPRPSPELPVGSMVEVTVCQRDPGIIGRRFRIERRMGGTFKIVPAYVLLEFVPVSRELP